MSEIYAFGDSVLKGVINNNGKMSISKNSFVRICENELELSIINKAKFGSTIAKGESILLKNLDLIRESSGKYVVLEFGGNDCDFVWDEVSNSPDSIHLSRTELTEFRDTYIRMIKAIQGCGKTPLLLTLPPIDSHKYLSWFSRTLDRNNITDWLQNDMYFTTSWHEMYNLELFKIARMCDVPIIDISSVFLAEKNYTKYLCVDGIHPNEEGHRIIANAIISQLKEW